MATITGGLQGEVNGVHLDAFLEAIGNVNFTFLSSDANGSIYVGNDGQVMATSLVQNTVMAENVTSLVLNGTGDQNATGNALSNVVTAGDGDNTVSLNAGNDWANTGAGADKVFGGVGNDTVVAGTGSDTLMGGVGRDSLAGGSGGDSLAGGRGADMLNAGAGNDNLSGGTGSDQLFGKTGNDMLSGGVGNDTLNGGQGNDTMTGGAGNDTFIIGNGSGDDRIVDFHAGDILQIADRNSDGAVEAGTDFDVSSVDGGTMISFDNGDSVFLVGVDSTKLVPGDDDGTFHI